MVWILWCAALPKGVIDEAELALGGGMPYRIHRAKKIILLTQTSLPTLCRSWSEGIVQSYKSSDDRVLGRSTFQNSAQALPLVNG
jgi:hypothetical protein